MMRKYWKAIILIPILGVLFAGVILESRAGFQNVDEADGETSAHRPVGISVGQLAPDFTGTTIEGESIHLGDLRGKIVLINVFASWCGPCRLETPHLVESYDQIDIQKIAFIGLNMGESPLAVAGFQKEFKVNYPLVTNQDGALTQIYKPIGLPTTWFIDTDGVVRYVFSGALTRQALMQILDDIAAGRDPDPFGSTS